MFQRGRHLQIMHHVSSVADVTLSILQSSAYRFDFSAELYSSDMHLRVGLLGLLIS
jgi:hypothetical protein